LWRISEGNSCNFGVSVPSGLSSLIIERWSIRGKNKETTIWRRDYWWEWEGERESVRVRLFVLISVAFLWWESHITSHHISCVTAPCLVYSRPRTVSIMHRTAIAFVLCCIVSVAWSCTYIPTQPLSQDCINQNPTKPYCLLANNLTAGCFQCYTDCDCDIGQFCSRAPGVCSFQIHQIFCIWVIICVPSFF
jgi:hypothetical protein